ncbi:hypothetical protein BH18ACT12_BH18ACT12_24570 [soil metagenome]
MQRESQRIRTRTGSRDQLERRTAQLVGAVSFLLAALLPFVLWRRAMAAVASDFRLDFTYLVTGWTGYGLIALGLLFSVPVLLSIGRSPESRLYARGRGAYAGWAAVLYLLGVLLASQVAQIAKGPADA